MRASLIAALVVVAIVPASLETASARTAQPQSPAVTATHDTAAPSEVPLQGGIYLLEAFQTPGAPEPATPGTTDEKDAPPDIVGAAGEALASQISRDVAAEAEAGARAGWLEVDVRTREVKAFTAASDAPRTGSFSSDFSTFLPDRGASMSVEVLGAQRFALTMELFETHRLTYRRVGADDADLRDIREARGRNLHQAHEQSESDAAALRALAAETVELDVRMSLPGNEASLALPANAQLLGRSPNYWLHWPDGDLELAVTDDPARADAIYHDARQRFDAMTREPLVLDDGTTLARDVFGSVRMLGRTSHEAHALVLQAEVDAAHVPSVLAIWRSLGAPVERMTPLRTPQMPAPDGLMTADAFDAAVDAALAALTKPEAFLDRRRFTPERAEALLGEAILLREGQDDDESLHVALELFEGAPEAVLHRFAGHAVAPNVGIGLFEGGCLAHAAIPVDLGNRRRPFTLVLRQMRLTVIDYATCLTAASALSQYTLSNKRRARVAPALIDGFSRYTHVREGQKGVLHVRQDDHVGVLAADGRIVVPVAYDRIDRDTPLPGWIVTRDRKHGFVSEAGRVIIPLEFDALEVTGDVLVATRDRRKGAFSPDGRALVPLEYDAIDVVGDGPLLRLRRDGSVAIFDPVRGEDIVPLSAGLTRFRRIDSTDRYRVRDARGQGLRDGRGRVLIEGADNIMRLGPAMLAVRAEPGGGYVIHDLDGQPLSDTRYASVRFDRDNERVGVRDMTGARYALDLDLQRITPPDLDTVYLPTEGGYTVVASRDEPRRMGMIAPDGSLVLPVVFREVYSMREGLIAAQSVLGRWSLWDQTGTRVLGGDQWQGLSQSFDGRMFARRDDLWRMIDRSGEALDARRWSSLQLHARNVRPHAPFATVQIGHGDDTGKWEVVDMRGERVVEGTFDAVEPADVGVRLIRDGEVILHPDD